MERPSIRFISMKAAVEVTQFSLSFLKKLDRGHPDYKIIRKAPTGGASVFDIQAYERLMLSESIDNNKNTKASPAPLV